MTEPEKMSFSIDFTDEQKRMISELVGIFGKDPGAVVNHILTASLPEFMDRARTTIESYKAIIDLHTYAKKVVEIAKRQQDGMDIT